MEHRFKENGHPVECKCPMCRVSDAARSILEHNPIRSPWWVRDQFFRGQTKSDVIKSMSEAASQSALSKDDMEAAMKTLSGETVSATWYEDCVKPLIAPPEQEPWIQELFKDIKDSPPCQCTGFHPTPEDIDKKIYRIFIEIDGQMYTVPITMRTAFGSCQ